MKWWLYGAVVALVLLAGIPARGWMLSVLWGWFIAPLIGVRGITLAEGIGVSLFLSATGIISLYDTHKWNVEDTSATEIFLKGVALSIAVGVIFPVFLVMAAWLWHSFLISPDGFQWSTFPFPR